MVHILIRYGIDVVNYFPLNLKEKMKLLNWNIQSNRFWMAKAGNTQIHDVSIDICCLFYVVNIVVVDIVGRHTK